ncbi:hypothetical protein HS041_01630 [Planomonospora sp. ID67723]|uniref:hypothetical protein n=1 Tax=Planomonospora sp. ID67723 TaxID=2738134 RepID=UPI0018C414DD|nr:hypothetical protein [Planomonospora sp. ID67723]MBG0826484.1 hypothetical protein [Planomonospora sp. ID67723]
MRKRSIVLAAMAGAAVLAAPAAASASTAGPASEVSSGVKTVSFRGMHLKVPSGWQVHRDGDWMLVQTGACETPAYFAPKCRGFWILGPKAIKYGKEGFGPYTGEQPFYPASDVQRCPFNGKHGQVIGKPTALGLRQVGRGHKAKYVSWFGRCVKYGNGEQTATFDQREWFLPTSKVLVVDVWKTPGLSNILKHATWS